jgi:hypothetical protein
LRRPLLGPPWEWAFSFAPELGLERQEGRTEFSTPSLNSPR